MKFGADQPRRIEPCGDRGKRAAVRLRRDHGAARIVVARGIGHDEDRDRAGHGHAGKRVIDADRDMGAANGDAGRGAGERLIVACNHGAFDPAQFGSRALARIGERLGLGAAAGGDDVDGLEPGGDRPIGRLPGAERADISGCAAADVEFEPDRPD